MYIIQRLKIVNTVFNGNGAKGKSNETDIYNCFNFIWLLSCIFYFTKLSYSYFVDTLCLYLCSSKVLICIGCGSFLPSPSSVFPNQNIFKPVLPNLSLVVACIFVFEAIKYMHKAVGMCENLWSFLGASAHYTYMCMDICTNVWFYIWNLASILVCLIHFVQMQVKLNLLIILRIPNLMSHDFFCQIFLLFELMTSCYAHICVYVSIL